MLIERPRGCCRSSCLHTKASELHLQHPFEYFFDVFEATAKANPFYYDPLDFCCIVVSCLRPLICYNNKLGYDSLRLRLTNAEKIHLPRLHPYSHQLHQHHDFDKLDLSHWKTGLDTLVILLSTRWQTVLIWWKTFLVFPPALLLSTTAKTTEVSTSPSPRGISKQINVVNWNSAVSVTDPKGQGPKMCQRQVSASEAEI